MKIEGGENGISGKKSGLSIKKILSNFAPIGNLAEANMIEFGKLILNYSKKPIN